jgi:RimJ/RimL family protein N-acetyltransferase
VHLGVSTGNEPARALYVSFGFEPFGLERAALVVDGAAIDELHMALVVAGRAEDPMAPDG